MISSATRHLTEPTHLITVRVEGRAVSWTPPRVGRHRVKKSASLIAWQKRVADEAKVAWGFHAPAHPGPVGLSFWFYLRDPGNAYHQSPDLTNLVKGMEDALQGIVIANDRMVCASHGERFFIPPDQKERAFVQVWAFPNGGRVEPVEPGPYSYTPWAWWLRPLSA